MINDWVNLKEDECQLVGSISRISSCVIWNGYNYFFIWSGLVNLGCYLRTMMGITMMSKYSTSKLQISQMNWNWKSKQSGLTSDSIRNWMQFYLVKMSPLFGVVRFDSILKRWNINQCLNFESLPVDCDCLVALERNLLWSDWHRNGHEFMYIFLTKYFRYNL